MRNRKWMLLIWLLLIFSLNTQNGAAAKSLVGPLQVGAGQAAIQIPEGFFPTQGFDGIHDDLYVKTLLFNNGIIQTAIVSVDMTSLSNIDGMKEVVQKNTGVKPENIFIYAAHNFSSPHVFGGDGDKKTAMFAQALNKALATSAKEASAGLKAAKIGYDTGISNVNINRDILTTEGWWHGSNAAAYSDKELGVMKIDDVSGKALAIFMNYSVQSSVLDESVSNEGKRMISADLAGAATKYIEEKYKAAGTIAFFGIGSAGDQSPILMANRYTMNDSGISVRKDIHDTGYIVLGLLGERLGADAVSVAQNITDKQSEVDLTVINDSVICQSQKMPERQKPADMKPVKQYAYQETGEIKVPIAIMKVGNIAIVGVQPELAAIIGADIKKKSPIKNTLVLTMVNGAAKYMADKDSYDKFTYEARNSHHAKGSAERVEAKILSMLETLK
ncbi:MAG: hypothetical protein H6Q73_3719 [Firmicutes bacterium]|nr:hypothetical protein [Bacillota bacterium]